jgi:hypothetical protein
VLDIDTWVGSSGKNGMRRDWLIRGRNSGDIFVRATRQAILPNDQWIDGATCAIKMSRGFIRLIFSHLEVRG